MKAKPFMQKMNPRLVAIHSIAMWMIIFAFDLLAKLYFLPVTRAFTYNKTTNGALKELEKQGFTALSLSYDSKIISLIPVLGLLIAFILSLSVSLFRQWFWLNSVPAFTIMFLLNRYNITGSHFLHVLFWAPGKLVKQDLIFFLTTDPPYF